MSGYTEASPTFSRPHVSYIEDEDLVIYDDIQPTDWSKEYLTLEALEDGKFNFFSERGDIANLYFSTDSGNTWTPMDTIMDDIDVHTGDKVMFKGTDLWQYEYGCGTFTSTCRFNAMGNPMTVYAGDEYASAQKHPYTFYRMFSGCTKLISAENLYIGTAVNDCCGEMFKGCTSLVTPPELPSTTVGSRCYMSMFEGCTSLVTAPDLPAQGIGIDCYSQMFSGCSSLNYIKCLATTQAQYNSTQNWVSGVSATGTFVKHPDATFWGEGTYIGDSGIPAGWTVETATE